jgi:DNA/RNA endonuclease G (NUC1)
MKNKKIWNVVEVYDRDYAMATGVKKQILYSGLTFEQAEEFRKVSEYGIYDGVSYYSTEKNY